MRIQVWRKFDDGISRIIFEKDRIDGIEAKILPDLNQPICIDCGRRKKPVGRDMPLGMYLCTHECDGYAKEPRAGTEWD